MSFLKSIAILGMVTGITILLFISDTRALVKTKWVLTMEVAKLVSNLMAFKSGSNRRRVSE